MQPSLIDQLPLALRPGEEPIAGFRLVRRRGRGGFGEVWEAAGPGGFPVALKFVPISPRGRSAELRALEFVREIHHPNLLTGFGSWLVDDTLIIGMDLADGSLWDRYLEATRQGYRGIPREELLGYLADAAAGIDHLNGYRHQVDGRPGVGIQHRDLKPPNILLFGGGAKVADLGMARAMEGEIAGHTGAWTIPYAAPEFFRGETTRQSDQYGLAATYCQLRGGRLPFSGSAATITAGHLFGQPDLDALPEPERAIVGRALAKEPGDRWPDCRTFVAALRAVPLDESAEILLDPDDPPVFPEDSSAWEVDGRSGRPAPSRLDAWPADSRWLLESTEPGRPASPESVPTLILERPLASLPPRVSPINVPRRVRRSALAGAALLMASLAARDIGPDRPPPFAPAAPKPAATTAARPEPAPLVIVPTAEVAAPLAPPVASDPSVELANLAPPADLTPDSKPASTEFLDLDSLPPVVGADPAREEPKPASSTEAVATRPAPVDLVQAAGLAVVGPEVPSPAPVAASAPDLAPLPEAIPDQVAAQAAFARGREAFTRRAFTQAIPEFTESLRLNPGHVTSLLLRGVARHRSGDPRGALADYDAVLLARPGDAHTAVSRGQAHHELGDYNQAAANYTEALRLRPGDGDIYFRRGLARFKAGDYAGAVDDFEATLRLDRNHLYANEFRIESLARRGTKTARPVASVPGPVPIPPGPKATAPPIAARETSLVAPAPATAAAPAARPAQAQARTAPRPADRRPGIVRRLVPWPFTRGR